MSNKFWNAPAWSIAKRNQSIPPSIKTPPPKKIPKSILVLETTTPPNPNYIKPLLGSNIRIYTESELPLELN